MERPISVTVIAWIIIAFALESLVGVLFRFAVEPTKEVPVLGPMHSPAILLLVASALVFFYIALAIFMLRGADWARIIYLWVTGLLAFGSLLALVRETQPVALIATNVAKFAVIAFFLCRKEANAFFSKTRTA